ISQRPRSPPPRLTRPRVDPRSLRRAGVRVRDPYRHWFCCCREPRGPGAARRSDRSLRRLRCGAPVAPATRWALAGGGNRLLGGFRPCYGSATRHRRGAAAGPRIARREGGTLSCPARGPVNLNGGDPRRGAGALPGQRLIPPMVILLGVTLAGGALITFTPQMSSSAAATTAGLTLLTATAALSRWRLGALADRYGAGRFLWPLILCTVLGLALAAAAVTDSASTRVTLLLLGMTFVGVAYGGLQNLTLLLSLSAVRRKDYNTASAVWNIGFDSGTGLGSVLVGSLAAGLSFPIALLAAA